MQWPFSPATILKKKELSGPRILKEESFGVLRGFGQGCNVGEAGGIGGEGAAGGGYGIGYSPNHINGLNLENSNGSPLLGRFHMIHEDNRSDECLTPRRLFD